jgi:hypothetical protein
MDTHDNPLIGLVLPTELRDTFDVYDSMNEAIARMTRPMASPNDVLGLTPDAIRQTTIEVLCERATEQHEEGWRHGYLRYLDLAKQLSAFGRNEPYAADVVAATEELEG